jgi:hypothetical protein
MISNFAIQLSEYYTLYYGAWAEDTFVIGINRMQYQRKRQNYNK